jgi:hypothetical protein
MAYTRSVVGLQEFCLTNGIGFQMMATEGFTNIDRVRNVLAAAFLWDTSATHMLFIDDDMGFNVQELVKMFLWRDKDVVAAMYPKRIFNWERMKQIVLANPDIESAQLPGLAAEYTFTLPPEASEMSVGNKPVPVARIGTGLMLISRQCLLRLIDQANLPTFTHPLSPGKVYEFFKTLTVDDNQLGEDCYFCDLVRRHGGEVLGCPWLSVTHTGPYSFVGDLKGLARYGQKR